MTTRRETLGYDAADLASMTRPRRVPPQGVVERDPRCRRRTPQPPTTASMAASNYNASALRSATSYIEIGTTYTDKATSILDSWY